MRIEDQFLKRKWVNDVDYLRVEDGDIADLGNQIVTNCYKIDRRKYVRKMLWRMMRVA